MKKRFKVPKCLKTKWLKKPEWSWLKRFFSRSTRFIPYLHLWLDLNTIQIRTALYYECMEMYTKEWVMLEILFFHKRRFEFRLYSPHRSKCS